MGSRSFSSISGFTHFLVGMALRTSLDELTIDLGGNPCSGACLSSFYTVERHRWLRRRNQCSCRRKSCWQLYDISRTPVDLLWLAGGPRCSRLETMPLRIFGGTSGKFVARDWRLAPSRRNVTLFDKQPALQLGETFFWFRRIPRWSTCETDKYSRKIRKHIWSRWERIVQRRSLVLKWCVEDYAQLSWFVWVLDAEVDYLMNPPFQFVGFKLSCKSQLDVLVDNFCVLLCVIWIALEAAFVWE